MCVCSLKFLYMHVRWGLSLQNVFSALFYRFTHLSAALPFRCIQLSQATVAPKPMRSLMKASINSLLNIMSTFEDALCSLSTLDWLAKYVESEGGCVLQVAHHKNVRVLFMAKIFHWFEAGFSTFQNAT